MASNRKSVKCPVCNSKRYVQRSIKAGHRRCIRCRVVYNMLTGEIVGHIVGAQMPNGSTISLDYTFVNY